MTYPEIDRQCAELSKYAYWSPPSITGVLVTLGYTSPVFFDTSDSPRGFVSMKDGVSFVAFRGTNAKSIADLLIDIDCPLVGVPGYKDWQAHQGFWDDFLRMRAMIQAAVLRTAPAVYTGHSAGGAIALLALLDAVMVDCVVTFNSPRCMNEAMASATNMRLPGKIRRYVYNGDLIHDLPISLTYRHAGAEICLAGPVSVDPLANHALARCIEAMGA